MDGDHIPTSRLPHRSGPIKVELTASEIQESNTVGFEVDTGLLSDDVGIELFICDRANPNVLVEAAGRRLGQGIPMVRNNPGSGRFRISRYDHVGGNQSYIADDNLVLVKLDGNPLFKWIIEAMNPN